MQKILRPVSKTIGINARRFFTKSSLITNKFSKSKCNFRLKFFAATTLTAAIPIASLLNSQEDQNDPLSKFKIDLFQFFVNLYWNEHVEKIWEKYPNLFPSFIAKAYYEMKNGDIDAAKQSLSKAREMSQSQKDLMHLLPTEEEFFSTPKTRVAQVVEDKVWVITFWQDLLPYNATLIKNEKGSKILINHHDFPKELLDSLHTMGKIDYIITNQHLKFQDSKIISFNELDKLSEEFKISKMNIDNNYKAIYHEESRSLLLDVGLQKSEEGWLYKTLCWCWNIKDFEIPKFEKVTMDVNSTQNFVKKILDLKIDRIIPINGNIIDDDVKVKFRDAFEWAFNPKEDNVSPKRENFYKRYPFEKTPDEFFEDLVEEEGTFKLERIVSTGQSSPPDYWYDQETDEWVMVLKGSAILSFIDGRNYILLEGDNVLIPKHCKHRVEWTSQNERTIWIALHYKPLK